MFSSFRSGLIMEMLRKLYLCTCKSAVNVPAGKVKIVAFGCIKKEFACHLLAFSRESKFQSEKIFIFDFMLLNEQCLFYNCFKMSAELLTSCTEIRIDPTLVFCFKIILQICESLKLIIFQIEILNKVFAITIIDLELLLCFFFFFCALLSHAHFRKHTFQQ